MTALECVTALDNSAIAPDHLRNIQHLAKLPNPHQLVSVALPSSAECLRCQLRRSASAVDSAIAPDHLRNTQPLAILPNPPLVGECRSAIVSRHFYSVGIHLSAWCPTSSHEPSHIRHESRPSNITVSAVINCKKPKYTAVGHRRRP